ncbi:hypothetical protein JCM14713_04220 [Desulfomicrobium salsuginis]
MGTSIYNDDAAMDVQASTSRDMPSAFPTAEGMDSRLRGNDPEALRSAGMVSAWTCAHFDVIPAKAGIHAFLNRPRDTQSPLHSPDTQTQRICEPSEPQSGVSSVPSVPGPAPREPR